MFSNMIAIPYTNISCSESTSTYCNRVNEVNRGISVTSKDMFGHGIGIILLNIGMYFVAPAVLIMFRKQFVKMVVGKKS